MKIDTYYKAKAEEIHKTCPVVDTHLDLAGELVFRLRNGEENPLRDIYLPAFRKGGRSGPVPERSSDWNYSLYGRPGLHRIRCEASDRSVGIGGTRGLPYLEQEKSAGVRLLQGK